MTLNVSLGIAERALQVNQYGVNVVSNNIANMNTEGYSRKRLELEESPTYRVFLSGKQYSLGTGVQIAGITSMRANYLDDYFRTQNGSGSYYSELSAGADKITNILNELGDTTLQEGFENFFAAFETLATNPSNSTYRLQVVEQAKTLVNQFNSISNRLTNERNLIIGDITDLTGGSLQNSNIATSIEDINSKLEQITQLNKSMLMSENSADIMNERSMLLDELSSMIPITTQSNPNGTVNVYLGNNALVKGGEQVSKFNLVQNYTDETHTKIDADTPVKIQLTYMDGTVRNPDLKDELNGGKLGAYLTLGCSQEGTLSYKNVLTDLDKMVNQFAAAMNSLQLDANEDGAPMAIAVDVATGKKTLTPSTVALFVSTNGEEINASNISFNSEINKNYNLIAAARVKVDGETGLPLDENAIGNSNNAILMANQYDANVPGLGGVSLRTFYTNMITRIGSQAAAIEKQNLIQDSVVSQINDDRTSIMGVNLDEELADLIKYQRAYEAATRIFSAASDMMALLVTLGQ